MTPPLFLVESLPLGSRTGAEFVLDGDEGRHGARVLRLRRGEAVSVADGRGSLLECEVVAAEGDTLRLMVRGARTVCEPVPRLVVVQALPKGERADLAVEILTELGVDEIVPWAAQRCVVRWDGPRGAKALEKWRRTSRAAAKQSRRARAPLMSDVASTDEVAARLDAGSPGSAFVLHEEATESLSSAELSQTGDLLLVVGPEGGIAPEELERFAAAGASAVRLGDPVLRTSTAGAAALAVLSARLGRWA